VSISGYVQQISSHLIVTVTGIDVEPQVVSLNATLTLYVPFFDGASTILAAHPV
jgi:hypothetical protein